jgi:4-diphosphocytidyl-2-C-methyl-D-erythritol kinase
MIREFAPAKINLFLHVGGRRDDGYHNLESLAVFASVGDEVTTEEAGALSLDVGGPFAAALKNEPDNLVLRAARKFGELAGIEPRVHITLTKNLPVAAGIGGGSSDAAATLRALSRLYPDRVALPQLWSAGGEIGSDVPVCVLPGCWWMTGRGERFVSISEIGTFDAVLVNAGASVYAAHAYSALTARTGEGQMPKPRRFATVADLADYLRRSRNDLEPPARTIAPVIGDTLDALIQNNALLARMSGSGGTCFGLYPSAIAAQAAAEAILRENPNWWVTPATLNRGRKWEIQ